MFVELFVTIINDYKLISQIKLETKGIRSILDKYLVHFNIA